MSTICPSPGPRRCALYYNSCYDGLYPGHIHTTPFQKALLAVGSGVAALQNPYRHDMVAVLGGDNRTPSVNKYQDKMRNDPEGYTILTKAQGSVCLHLILNEMASLPDGSLGREYLRFLEENVSVRVQTDYISSEFPLLSFSFAFTHAFTFLFCQIVTPRLKGRREVLWTMRS
uniref:Coenzyme Q4 homolog (S. cerevisiae) n=1 Tax=Cyclopterus lumpus TaxID=8103 RepID=A0A8C2ZF37_CYCLU